MDAKANLPQQENKAPYQVIGDQMRTDVLQVFERFGSPISDIHALMENCPDFQFYAFGEQVTSVSGINSKLQIRTLPEPVVDQLKKLPSLICILQSSDIIMDNPNKPGLYGALQISALTLGQQDIDLDPPMIEFLQSVADIFEEKVDPTSDVLSWARNMSIEIAEITQPSNPRTLGFKLDTGTMPNSMRFMPEVEFFLRDKYQIQPDDRINPNVLARVFFDPEFSDVLLRGVQAHKDLLCMGEEGLEFAGEGTNSPDEYYWDEEKNPYTVPLDQFPKETLSTLEEQKEIQELLKNPINIAITVEVQACDRVLASSKGKKVMSRQVFHEQLAQLLPDLPNPAGYDNLDVAHVSKIVKNPTGGSHNHVLWVVYSVSGGVVYTQENPHDQPIVQVLD